MFITNYYQPWLLPFLSLRTRPLALSVRRSYYHSFEDGLWDLLQKRNIRPHAVILLPDFYCIDVIENIRTHGYTPIQYPVDAHFQVVPETLETYVNRYAPSVIIIFHAAGITSHVVHHPLVRRVVKRTIIIEDCVHRLIDPSRVRIMHRNHYLIDSLRKTTPLPGSMVYSSDSTTDVSRTHPFLNMYVLQSMMLYILFRVTFVLGLTTRSVRLVRVAHTKILKAHDDVIGDRLVPTRGLPFISHLIRHVDVPRIESMKADQVRQYIHHLSSLKKPFYAMHIPSQDYGKLHVYPLGFRGKFDTSLIEFLHEKGVVVWNKFPDAPWSRRRAVIFLPLGFHVNEKHIRYIAASINEWQLRH